MIGAARDSQNVIYYARKMPEGTIIYVEDIISGSKNKGLRSKTMFKRIKDLTEGKFKNIASMNSRNDVSKAKIVSPVGTGSNPSCTPNQSAAVANPVQPSGLLSNNNIT